MLVVDGLAWEEHIGSGPHSATATTTDSEGYSPRSAARDAKARKIGAHGLRMVLEQTMFELMFEYFSRGDRKELIVTPDVISHTCSNASPPRALARAV